MSLTKTRDSCWKQEIGKLHRVDSGYNSKPDEIEIGSLDYARLMNVYVVGGVETKQVTEGDICHRYMIQYFYDYVVGAGVDEMTTYSGCTYTQSVRFLKIGTQQQWSEFTRGFAAQFAGDNS